MLRRLDPVQEGDHRGEGFLGVHGMNMYTEETLSAMVAFLNRIQATKHLAK